MSEMARRVMSDIGNIKASAAKEPDRPSERASSPPPSDSANPDERYIRRLRAALETVEKERDEAREALAAAEAERDAFSDHCDHWEERALKAEAERDVLRDHIEDIAYYAKTPEAIVIRARDAPIGSGDTGGGE